MEILKSEQDHTRRLVEEKLRRDVEMRQYEQDARSKENHQICASLLDKIIDIADEAYKHRQLMDSDKIDPRNWHEWLQLFIHEKEIANTHQNLASLVSEETAGSKSTKLETQEDEANVKLDELEMIDYIKNRGQWSKELVTSNKPNLEHILVPPVENQPVVAGKKGAPAKAAQAQQEVQFDAEDLEVKDEPDNNFLLGDAIETIIKLNHEDRPPLKHPQNPNWLPYKLAFVGYPFAGKKSQARAIAGQYGLDVFMMEELISEALEFYHNNTEPIEPKPQQAQADLLNTSGFTTFDHSALGDSEDEDRMINTAEDFRMCGECIQEKLCNGEEITDELYV